MYNPKKLIFKTSFVVALLMTFSLLLVGCDDDKKVREEKNNKEISSEETSNKNKELEKYAINVGSYEVGKDLTAGEYMAVSEDYGYVEVYREKTEEELKASSADIWQVIFNTTLTEKSNAYVEVQDGENIEVIGAKLYPIAKAPTIVTSDKSLYSNGMYKVGRDIPEGTYDIKPIVNKDADADEDKIIEADKDKNKEPKSYVEIYKSARFIASEDLKSIPVNDPSSIKLTTGEFLLLKDVEITINKQVKKK